MTIISVIGQIIWIDAKFFTCCFIFNLKYLKDRNICNYVDFKYNYRKNSCNKTNETVKYAILNIF